MTGSATIARLAWLLIAAAALVGRREWLAVLIVLSPITRHARASGAGRNLRREVRFREHRISLWPPVRVAVKRIELAEPGRFRARSAFSARGARSRRRRVGAVHGPRAVRQLVLDQPAVHLLPARTARRTSTASPPGPAGAIAGSAALDHRRASLIVRDGHVLVDDLAQERRTTFAIGTHLDLSAEQGARASRRRGNHAVRLAFGPLAAARRERSRPGVSRSSRCVCATAASTMRKSHRLRARKLAIDLGRAEIVLAASSTASPRGRCYDLRRAASGSTSSSCVVISVADAAPCRASPAR